MSWVPAFKIGLWNAWILMLYWPLLQLIVTLVDKAVGTGQIMKKMGDVPLDKKEKRANTTGMVQRPWRGVKRMPSSGTAAPSFASP
jgi:hypothetical protein